jgi:hypothetical protein
MFVCVVSNVVSYISFYHGTAALVGQGLHVVEGSWSHSDAPHSVGLLWTSDQPTQGFLPDNTQHSRETDAHAPGGIRTHNPSKRATAYPRHRSATGIGVLSFIYCKNTRQMASRTELCGNPG